MNISRQTLNQRRLLILIAGFIILVFALYLGYNVFATSHLSYLKAGFQNLEFDGFSPAAVFFLLIAATLISEDLTCISAGVLASQGKISLAAAIIACAVGIFIGDVLTFLAGRILGRRALSWKVTRYFLSEEAVEKSSAWLAKQGMKTVFISRFVFGMRLPLYFGAGVLKTSFWRFTLYFSLAVAVWTPIVVALTYKIGAEAVKMSLFNQNIWFGLIVLIVILYILFRFFQHLLTPKSRKGLIG